jgi:C-terminal processing protease CtpA/Prc
MDPERDWSAEIGTLISQLAEYYVLPDVGQQAGRVLRERLDGGHYRGLPDEAALADPVTGDMQSVNGDPHLFLQYVEQEIPERDDPVVDDGQLRAERALLTGHGFARVERLPGNVALLDIRHFFDPATAGSAAVAAAAMHLVASADALIIDLRRNTGGEPDMVTHVASYLFGQRTHLFDLHFPAAGRTEQYWSAPVAGPAPGGSKPVWALISGQTFSGGEAFSYLLQQRGRATLVGEPTTGGPVYFHYPYRVSAHLLSAIPSGYPADPVSGTNWGEKGVIPDIREPAGQALTAAYRLALEHVLGLGADGPRRKVAADARTTLAGLSDF